MKRRKYSRVGALNTRGITSNAVEALTMTGGFIAGGLITKNIAFLGDNPNAANFVKLAGGVILATQMSGVVGNMGIGLAANGIYNIVAPQLNLPAVNRLLPPGEASFSLSGAPQAMPQGQTTIEVQ